jgi:hypothetical protein
VRAREYDPASGNFQALDPVAQPQTAPFAGVYTYALRNPAVYVDPTGGSSSCVSGPCDLGGILINTGSLPPDLGPGPEPCGGPSGQVTLCAPLPTPTGTDTTCGAVGTLASCVEPPGPSGTDQTCSFVYGAMASCAPGPASTGTDSWCGGASDVMGSCEDTFIAALLSGGTQSADESTGSNAPTPCPITSVDQIFGDPWILAGKTPAEVEAAIGTLPDWQVETLGQGAHKGQGWVLREYTDGGLMTGRMIRWHPGGGRHGDDPYWRVSSPEGGKSPIIPS